MPRITGTLAAFGAGAFIASLALELVAPTVNALGDTDHYGHLVTNFFGLLSGAVAGEILFVVLDQLVNAHGGFLQKSATTTAYLTARRSQTMGHESGHTPQLGMDIPTPSEIRQVRAEHSGAPLAVWLGILLDGIPESFVIGSGFLALLSMKRAASPDVAFFEIIPYTLLAGISLSNFPETMSRSVGMKIQGWATRRILFM